MLIRVSFCLAYSQDWSKLFFSKNLGFMKKFCKKVYTFHRIWGGDILTKKLML